VSLWGVCECVCEGEYVCLSVSGVCVGLCECVCGSVSMCECLCGVCVCLWVCVSF
jgi:hypothetical protein